MPLFGGVKDPEKLGIYLVKKLNAQLGVEDCELVATERPSSKQIGQSHYTYQIRVPYYPINGDLPREEIIKLKEVFGKEVFAMPRNFREEREDGKMTIEITTSNPTIAVSLAKQNDANFFDSLSFKQK